MTQLSFQLPKIDREATKDAVAAALEKYRLYVLMEPEERLPKVTQTFSLVPPSNNGFHSSTEDAAITNVDQERYRKEYIERIRKAVNRLSYQERAIIIRRYMTHEDIFDYEVYSELGMSERKYYRVKGRAFYKLAFILRIEVMEEPEPAA
ncbi:ArpU family phage packaging/lysis transcriptional regulator [Fictibacillus gelatini]|uniref:ArpU family phage packaging/lysis transcriptional regulator n=1 Tax=Fictibacillus gelatini TaxID=225985 RepID=UPI000411BE75|nr:ArpU family phage packaging/lysis transcriptional regulator [Fictibacillus gelatini]